MKKSSLILALFASTLIMFSTACNNDDDSQVNNGNDNRQGTLYYSAAGELIRYNFQTKQEINLFSEGDQYWVSSDQKRFVWYKNNFYDGTTQVQIHNLTNPTEYQAITLPYILDQTPRTIPGSDQQYTALARAEDGAVERQDLVVFNSDNPNSSGRIPHVKAFSITPGGNDIVIAVEALDEAGSAMGFALAVVKNFRSVEGQSSFIIHEYPNYNQLPTDISISPNGQELVFTQMDHLYTVNIQPEATPKQITTSRFREADAAWSKDGKHIVFTANITGTTDDCGEIRIIPAHPKEIISVPQDGSDNEPVDELQPVDNSGKTIHSCGSEPIFWF